MTELDPIDRPQFSVCRYYVDKTYSYSVRQSLLTDAVMVFVKAINHVDARTGVISRVIMTDGGDLIVAEWKYGEGMVFPPKLKGMQLYVKAPQPRPDEALENLTPSDARWHRGILSVRSASR